jgi:hypothetical protein
VRSANHLGSSVSGDQDKAQTCCDIVKLGDQIEQAYERGASTDELNQQMGKLDEKLGPEWSASITAYRDVDLNTEDLNNKAGPELRQCRRQSRRLITCVVPRPVGASDG